MNQITGSLKKMSDVALHEKVLVLAGQDRKLSNFILEHLKEVDRQKLWAKMAYASLYGYCLKGLGYSESDSYRKMSAVQIVEEIPEVQMQLERGNLNLTTIAKAQSFFKRAARTRKVKISIEEKKKVLGTVENKTQREVDRELAALLPEAAKPDRVRFISQDQVQMSHVADQSLVEKLKRLRELLAHSVSRNCDQNELLHKICDIALSHVDPLVKAQKSNCPKPQQKFSSMRISGDEPDQSRYIPAKLRREVWLRDHGACTFVDPRTGEKCQCRFALQVDHILAFAKGGATVLENLRLLCRSHNRYAAIQAFGVRKIYESERRRA